MFAVMPEKYSRLQKKDGDISQDELDRAEKELEQLTQATVDTIDKAFTRKEHELLEV